MQLLHYRYSNFLLQLKVPMLKTIERSEVKLILYILMLVNKRQPLATRVRKSLSQPRHRNM